MWKQSISWFALLGSLLVVVLQRQTISQLKNELLTSHIRSKRSIEDNSLYVPVFAQISKKAMKRLCRQQSRRNVKSEVTATTEYPDTNYRKKCNGDVSFSPPRLITTRPHTDGSAMRDGEHWFVTEFHLGYNVLFFSSTKNLNQSSPHEVFTLPYPFQGTDMIFFNKTIFYNSAEKIIAYNTHSNTVKDLKLPLSMLPLYNGSSSIVDVQVEEHGLWIVYRRSGEKSLTVRRLVPSTLKVVSTWLLIDMDPFDWCNSFIRCGMLYSVRCGAVGLRIQPVYDFYQNIQISGRGDKFPEITTVSSVQFDPKSSSVVVFSSGKIFSLIAV